MQMANVLQHNVRLPGRLAESAAVSASRRDIDTKAI
jgi:hypothetical protein